MNRHIYILSALLLLPLAGLLPATATAQLYIAHSVQQPSLFVADAGADRSGCVGDSVLLGGANTAGGGTPPYAYNWNPVLGLNSNSIANPTAGISSNTSYLVQVVDGNNCSAEDTVAVIVNMPVAAFSSMATNLAVNFSDLSTGNTGTAWFWDFGDGNTSFSQNPNYTYSMAGTYTVCLTVDQGTFCSDSSCQTITVTAVGLEDGVQGTLNVYPNPVSGNSVNFELVGVNLTDDLIIEWFDLKGRRVNRYVGAATATVHRMKRSGLAAGVYEYRLASGGAVLGSGKLILE